MQITANRPQRKLRAVFIFNIKKYPTIQSVAAVDKIEHPPYCDDFIRHRNRKLVDYPSCSHKKKTSTILWRLLMFALPIFTASRPATIVGVHELNFCVRDGNRWTLMTINTNSLTEEVFPFLYKTYFPGFCYSPLCKFIYW